MGPDPGTGSIPAASGVGDFEGALDLARHDPGALSEPANEPLALALFAATGDQVDAVAEVADELRRRRVGDEVTFVVNRNINFTNVCYTGCRFCAFAQRETDADAFTLSPQEIAERVLQAWGDGATEICMQGGIHPRLPGTAYFDLAQTVKAAAPGIHCTRSVRWRWSTVPPAAMSASGTSW